MSYFIQFDNSKKFIILDDVESFTLCGTITLVRYTDSKVEELTNVLGISAYFYNKG